MFCFHGARFSCHFFMWSRAIVVQPFWKSFRGGGVVVKPLNYWPLNPNFTFLVQILTCAKDISREVQQWVPRAISKTWWRLCHGLGRIPASGVGDFVKINAMIHHSISSGKHLHFQHDNDPKSTSYAVQIYPDRKVHSGAISAMDWPPQSTDLNITEAEWDSLGIVYLHILGHYCNYFLFSKHNI